MKKVFLVTCSLYVIKTVLAVSVIDGLRTGIMYAVIDVLILILIWMQLLIQSDMRRFRSLWSRIAGSRYVQFLQRRYRSRDYHERLDEVERYVRNVLSPYMSEDDMEQFVRAVRTGRSQACDTDGRLKSADLRHLAWNIGERLFWNGETKARFIKECFPSQLGEFEIESLMRTFRTGRRCVIELDIPSPWDYRFHDR